MSEMVDDRRLYWNRKNLVTNTTALFDVMVELVLAAASVKRVCVVCYCCKGAVREEGHGTGIRCPPRARSSSDLSGPRAGKYLISALI